MCSFDRCFSLIRKSFDLIHSYTQQRVRLPSSASCPGSRLLGSFTTSVMRNAPALTDQSLERSRLPVTNRWSLGCFWVADNTLGTVKPNPFSAERACKRAYQP